MKSLDYLMNKLTLAVDIGTQFYYILATRNIFSEGQTMVAKISKPMTIETRERLDEYKRNRITIEPRHDIGKEAYELFTTTDMTWHEIAAKLNAADYLSAHDQADDYAMSIGCNLMR